MSDDSGDSGGLQTKVYQVGPISPGVSFPVTICDADQNPVKGIVFNYSVDGGDQQSGTTDDSGTLAVNAPASRAKISISTA